MKRLTKENLEKELNYIPCFTFLSDKGTNVDRVFGIIYNHLKNSDSEIFDISASKVGSILGLRRQAVYKILNILLSMEILVSFGVKKSLHYKINYRSIEKLSRNKSVGNTNLSKLLD